MRRLLLLLSFLCVLPVLPAQAAPCTSPAGPEGKIIYGSVSKQFYFCNGTGWMGISVRAGTGSGGCNLAPHGTRAEGTIVYNKDEQVLQGCSGGNWAGQVGDGTLVNAINPVQEITGATNWVSVSAMQGTSCALKTDKTRWCWGDAGDVTPETPARADLQTDWAVISVGDSHYCGIKSSGIVMCMGNNYNGQVGAGIPLSDVPIRNVECVSPLRMEGTVLYNSVTHVMQYCDGNNWVRLGR